MQNLIFSKVADGDHIAFLNTEKVNDKDVLWVVLKNNWRVSTKLEYLVKFSISTYFRPIIHLQKTFLRKPWFCDFCIKWGLKEIAIPQDFYSE